MERVIKERVVKLVNWGLGGQVTKVRGILGNMGIERESAFGHSWK